MINRERLLETFLQLVVIDSPSGRELDVANRLTEILKALGGAVYMDDAALKVGGNCGNLFARFEGNVEAPSVLLSCHMDTVQPGEGIKPIVEGDIVKSDGTTILGHDDKGGIAIVLEVLRVIRENALPHPTIEVVFSVGEEQGLLGAKEIDKKAITAKYGIVFDAAGEAGDIIIASPYQRNIEARFEGRAAHAGICPENGVSAIAAAAEAISRMKLLRIDDETTANAGRITGGTADNIVPESCTVTFEARSHSRDKLDVQIDHMRACCEEGALRHSALLSFREIPKYDGYRLEDHCKALLMAEKAFGKIGLPTRRVVAGGGCDANIFGGYGIECVNVAMGAQNFHSVNECAPISAMVKTAQAVVAFLELACEEA